ncbi:MAG: A24 family peptidase [Planctomycetota bacterium]
MYPDISGWVLIVCTSIFTLAAAWIDYRVQRIPNYLTLPAFFLGWVYQLGFFGFSGLLDGLQGFAIGFGMYFILWLIGSGGGGDAKLAGAVSVWLGFHRTLAMIVVSTIFVILGTGFVMLWGMLTKGVYKTKAQMLPSSDTSAKNKKRLELLKINRGRVGMSFGLSVALATVLITTFDVPRQAYKKHMAQQKAAQPKQPAPQAAPADAVTPKPSEKTNTEKTNPEAQPVEKNS